VSDGGKTGRHPSEGVFWCLCGVKGGFVCVYRCGFIVVTPLVNVDSL
jgi:hypothetical protein